MYWSIPRDREGQTAIIVAGGPSLDLAQVRQVARIRIKRDDETLVVAVNDAVYPCWWADWLHFCDAKWAHWHASAVAKFAGIKTTLDDTLPLAWGVKVLNNTGRDGFDPDPACCRHGANSAYQATHSVIHAGVSRILLLGVDLKPSRAGERHWFGDHPQPTNPDFGKWASAFETLLPSLRERGIEVVNCSPGSALEAFPKQPLESALP